MRDAELLNSVPEWAFAHGWISDGLRVLETRDPGRAEEFVTTTIPDAAKGGALGRYDDSRWRQAVLATFFADLASYTTASDQVNFDRLAFVMHAFPSGFRTYWAPMADGRWWPVGYSAWYPMLASAFELLDRRPSELENRMVVPATIRSDVAPFVYVFNYSVAPTFKKTELSKALVKALAAEIEAARPCALACIAVSPEGCRVAERFGMRRSGTFTLDTETETVFTWRDAI